jgi:hypothetical protein
MVNREIGHCPCQTRVAQPPRLWVSVEIPRLTGERAALQGRENDPKEILPNAVGPRAAQQSAQN